jgi:hypothetical protein
MDAFDRSVEPNPNLAGLQHRRGASRATIEIGKVSARAERRETRTLRLAQFVQKEFSLSCRFPLRPNDYKMNGRRDEPSSA